MSCSTMSTAPEAPTGGAHDPMSKNSQTLKSCWSCRLVSGGGLIMSGLYVFSAARRVMRQVGHNSVGTVAQFTFAAGLATWGVFIIADPAGRSQESRKT